MDLIKWIIGSYFGLLFGIIGLFYLIMMLLSIISYFIQELVMKLKIQIDTGFVKDGGKGSFWRVVDLNNLFIEGKDERKVIDDVVKKLGDEHIIIDLGRPLTSNQILQIIVVYFQ